MSDAGLEAPGSPEDDAPLFPLDGKYLSVQDREDILGMPEIQREEILADRAQQVLKRQQDLQLKKAFAEAKSNAASKKKRSAKDADLSDESGKRATRPKADKTRSALDDYKKAREMKGTDRGRVVGARYDRHTPNSRSPVGSGRDADGESEVEWAEPSDLHRRSTRDEPPADMKDFQRCRVGRSNFAKVCFYPGFEEAITGCYTRVSIGPDQATGQNQYRMAQIKKFVEGKPYHMEGSNGKRFTSDIYALVSHGKAERPWPFLACSDSKFTDQELDHYIDTLNKDSMRIPTKAYLSQKVDDINKLLAIDWTDEKLSQKFAKQKAMQIRCDPANVAKIKREKIEKKMADAQETGDAEEVVRCEAELVALTNSSANANGTNGVKAPPFKKPAPGRQDQLAKVNSDNRARNAQEVRKALLEEKRKLNLARAQARAEAKAKEEADAAKKAEEAAKAKMLSLPKDEMADLFGDGSDMSRAATPDVGKPQIKRRKKSPPVNGAKVTGRNKMMDDDIVANLDMGIDIEI